MREDGDTWQVDSTMDISWDSGSIGGLDEEVSIDLARFKWEMMMSPYLTASAK